MGKQVATDENLAKWRQMHRNDTDLMGDRVNALLDLIEQERESDYWYGLWRNVDHNLKEADQELMRRRMAIGGLLVALGKLPDLPPEVLSAIATARSVINVEDPATAKETAQAVSQ